MRYTYKAHSLDYRTLPRSYPHCIMISSQTINKQVGIAVIQRSALVNRWPELSDESASVLSCLEEKNAASDNKNISGDSMSVPIIIFGKISPGEESAILLPNAKITITNTVVIIPARLRRYIQIS
jgi:hypothetical protein